MEALAALSLAGNIAQFAELGVKLVVTAVRLYKDEGIPDFAEIEAVNADIQRMMQSIKSNQASTHDTDLEILSQMCIDVSIDLKTLLDGVKIAKRKDTASESGSLAKESNSKAKESALRARERALRARESALKAIKSHFQKGKIKGLEDRIFRLRDRVCAHVAMLMREEQKSFTDSINHLVSEAGTGRYIQAKVLENLEHISKVLESSHSEDIQASMKTYLDACIDTSQHLTVAEQILRSLHYPQIYDRQDSIAHAYRETFGWIFESNSDYNFSSWAKCERSDELYWIAGRAGSGKSTLMKYIAENANTERLLQEWARKTNVIITTHYFWDAGTSLQKCQTGLLRSLLLQILLHAVDILPDILPECFQTTRSAKLSNIGISWTHKELLKALQSIAEYGELPFRLAIFIDGLDEYNGDHTKLIHILRGLARSPSIKICVSSRPWIAFLDAFRGSEWKLNVHDLTRKDIATYIRGHLLGHSRFLTSQNIVSDIPDLEPLINLMEEKAQGVFLWVYLVTRSLERGLTNGDEIIDLQKRVDELPSDLEEYFHVIFTRIEPVYRKRVARLFRMLKYGGSMTLFHHFVAEGQYFDPKYSFAEQAVFDALTPKLGEVILKQRRKVAAQATDLVSIRGDKLRSDSQEPRVDFLHRTVADFVQTESVESQIARNCGSDFDPARALRLAHLAVLKAVRHFMSPCTLEPTNEHRATCFQRMGEGAIFTRTWVEPTLESLMESLRSNVDLEVCLQLHCVVKDTAYFRYFLIEKRCRTFFELTQNYHLNITLSNTTRHMFTKWDVENVLQLQPIDLLNMSSKPSSTTKPIAIDLELLDYLMNIMVSPNCSVYGGRTLWGEFLRQALQYSGEMNQSKGAADIFDAAQLMIDHEAARNTTVRVDSEPADFMLREVFNKQEASHLIQLFGPERPPEVSETTLSLLTFTNQTLVTPAVLTAWEASTATLAYVGKAASVAATALSDALVQFKQSAQQPPEADSAALPRRLSRLDSWEIVEADNGKSQSAKDSLGS